MFTRKHTRMIFPVSQAERNNICCLDNTNKCRHESEHQRYMYHRQLSTIRIVREGNGLIHILDRLYKPIVVVECHKTSTEYLYYAFIDKPFQWLEQNHPRDLV